MTVSVYDGHGFIFVHQYIIPFLYLDQVLLCDVYKTKRLYNVISCIFMPIGVCNNLLNKILKLLQNQLKVPY